MSDRNVIRQFLHDLADTVLAAIYTDAVEEPGETGGTDESAGGDEAEAPKVETPVETGEVIPEPIEELLPEPPPAPEIAVLPVAPVVQPALVQPPAATKPTAAPTSVTGVVANIDSMSASDVTVNVTWNPAAGAEGYHVYAPGFRDRAMPFDDRIPGVAHTVTVQREASDWQLAIRVTPYNSVGSGQREIATVTIPKKEASPVAQLGIGGPTTPPTPPPTFAIDQTAIPPAVNGVAYNFQLTHSNAQGAVTYTLESGAWPSGITMLSSGLIAGTHTGTGTFNVTVRANDTVSNATPDRAYTFNVNTASSYVVPNPAPPVGVPDLPVNGVDYARAGARSVYVGTGTNNPGGLDDEFINADPVVALDAFRAAFNTNAGGVYSNDVRVFRDHGDIFQRQLWAGTEWSDHGGYVEWTTTAVARQDPMAEGRRYPSHRPELVLHRRINVQPEAGVVVDTDFNSTWVFVSHSFESVTTTPTSVCGVHFLMGSVDTDLCSGWKFIGCEFNSNANSRADQQRRDVFLNANDVTFANCYSHGCMDLGAADSQCVLHFQGQRVLHYNWHFGGASELTMIGGGDPVTESLMASDVLFDRCFRYNPPIRHTNYATSGTYVKNMFELKYGLRIEVRNFHYENAWRGDNQPGYAFLIKDVNQEGTAGKGWQRTWDVFIHDGLVDNTMVAVSMAEATQGPSGGTQNCVVDNVLFRNVGAANTFDGATIGTEKVIIIIPSQSTDKATIGPLPTRLSRLGVDWGDTNPAWGMAVENNGSAYGNTEAFEMKGCIFPPSQYGPGVASGLDGAISGGHIGTTHLHVDHMVLAGKSSTAFDDPALGSNFHFPVDRAAIGWDADMRTPGQPWDNANYPDVDAIAAVVGTFTNPLIRTPAGELNTNG